MGLNIGTVGDGSSLIRSLSGRPQPTTLPPLGGASDENNPPSVGFGADEEAQRPGFPPRNPPEPDRVGFGQGTVSTPTASLRTLNRGLASARRLVPSAEQTREEIRARAAERREENRTRSLRRLESRRPEPAVQARNFVNTLDETAGLTQRRVSGAEEEPGTQGGPSIQFRTGETVAAQSRNTGLRIDFLA